MCIMGCLWYSTSLDPAYVDRLLRHAVHYKETT